MAGEIHSFKADDGLDIFYRLWRPEASVRQIGVVHILHGMAEHGGRYDDFATFLAKAGYAVYAQDHRGHGLTAQRNHAPFGFFAEKDGWRRIMEDSMALDRIILSEQPQGLPQFLLGHSMGSFLARSVMACQPELYRGVIIMGTGASKGLLGKVGLWLAGRHIRKMGASKPDPALTKLSFGSYLKHIPQPKSGSDWLSRDAQAVQRYEADPLCGFTCSTSFFRDLLVGVEYANDPANARKLPSSLPVLVISGSEDPVGDWSKGVRRVYDLYKGAALRDLTLHLVDGGRHEILNETDKEKTYQILLEWMEERSRCPR